MDTKEFLGLVEAYAEVYAPQEEIEEGLRSAVKRLLGRGENDAEAPKPMSRGEVLRQRYNVGPEKSDTSAKRQILNRSRARAERDEDKYGGSVYTKKVADKSKEAHDRYLKAGYSKYGADMKHGRGNKAAKRAAALKNEEFDWIVNTLLDEGYDLSSYSYDEFYDICLEEVEQIDEAEGSYGTTPKAYSAARGTKMTAKRKPFLKKMLSRTNPANRTPDDSPRKGMTSDDRERARAGSKHGVGTRQDHDYPSQGAGGVTKSAKKLRKQKAMGEFAKEEFDIFDVVLEFLQVEGFAETLEEAEWMMANQLDSEDINAIVEAMHEDEEDEEDEEMKKGKKSKKSEEDEDDEEEDDLKEASYSAKAAREGKDIGKPGKQFAKIAKEAGKRYGSKERGEKVAGAVLARIRAKKG
jgi:hypothetical protein